MDDLLFELGDATLELVDVGWRAETGLAPGLLDELLGQFPLQLPDAGGLAGDLAVGVS